jgi:hypothetical protein
MFTESPFLFIASMDVEPERERSFNEIYDSEHIPYLLQVPGVAGVGRYRAVPFHVSIGGTVREVEAQRPRYHALYALAQPDVLVSPQWTEAVDRGRWPSEVRPFTRERRQMLLERIGT